MCRFAEIVLAYVVQYLKTRLAYKADFFISGVAELLNHAAAFLFIMVVFTKVDDLNGWSFHEVLFIYGFSLIPLSMFNFFFGNIYSLGSRYIIQGEFDRILLRPVNSFLQVALDEIYVEDLNGVVTGSIIVGYASMKLGVAWSLWKVLALLPLAVSGAVIYCSVFTMLGAVGFWFEDRMGLIPPFYNMIDFSKYPVTIYSKFLRFLLSWVVPFAFVAFYPSAILLDRTEFIATAALTPLVASAFALLAAMVWQRGIRQYKSSGT